MSEVGSYEAKTYLPKLLDRVGKGERIDITRHGVIIATLVPSGSSKDEPAGSVISAIFDFRNGRRLGSSVSLKDLIEEGRR